MNSPNLEASAVSVDDKLCGPNAVPVGVAVATVVDDLLVDLVEDVVILTAFSMPGSRVELGIVWVTGWSTVVVANTPLLKLSRPRCLPKLLRPNLGDMVGWNLVLDRNGLNWEVELARRERNTIKQIQE